MNYKAILSNTIAAILFFGILLVNTKSLVKSRNSSSELTLVSLMSQASAGEENGNGTVPNQNCTTDNCQIERTIGVPPYQVTTVHSGRYMHCSYSSGGSCSPGSCNRPCDAGGF